MGVTSFETSIALGLIRAEPRCETIAKSDDRLSMDQQRFRTERLEPAFAVSRKQAGGVNRRTILLATLAFPLVRTPAAKADFHSRTAWLSGVNLSGGEFNPSRSRISFDYTYPTEADIDYFVARGLRTLRIPVLSDRLFRSNGSGELTETSDWTIVTKLISHAEKVGAFVIIDPHQYGRMSSGLIGRDGEATKAFVTFWGEVARRLKRQDNVIFGLMNEPNQQSATEWLTATNAAIAAIRSAGTRQLILAPGAYWSGAHSWTSTDNASVMAGVHDPGKNFAFEVHQYLDSNNSGTSPEVVKGAGAKRLVAFTEWAHAKGFRGFLGEFGFAATPEAEAEGRALLAYIAHNRDVWMGWTYWAAGPWMADYMFSVQPKGGADRSQMRVLQDYK